MIAFKMLGVDLRGALFKFFLVGLALGILTSCSKFGRLSKGEGTKVTFHRAGSDGKRAGPDQLGGVMIWGVSPTTNETISFKLATNSATYSNTFKNGDWQFYATSWIGPSELQGAARCAATTATFTGTDANVSIALSTDDCDNPFFGDSSFLDGSAQFQPLKLVSCAIYPNPTDGDEDCNTFEGDYGSYQIVMGANPNFTPLVRFSLLMPQTLLLLAVKTSLAPSAILKHFPPFRFRWGMVGVLRSTQKFLPIQERAVAAPQMNWSTITV